MTTISPDARRIWLAVRAPVAIGLLIIAVSVVVVIARGGGGGPLDPGSVEPDGSRALARLLAAQGVHVDVAHTIAEATGATVLITTPDLVPPQRLREIDGDLVLIAPDQDTVDAALPGTRLIGETEVTDRHPQCAQHDAAAAGPATMGGLQYRSDATECYDATMLRSTMDDRTITVLGTDAPLTNERLDEQGNAALAMRLLGQHERLVWFIPSPADPALRPSQRPLTDLVPDAVKFGFLQLVIAVVLLALWRARRLGPVVTEPLPVVVRAAETVEGRARLYRRAGAADHASEALRQAARDRLARRLGLPAHYQPQDLVARLGNEDVLYGPPAADDTELVRLADALDDLERHA
jgi:hypothetical protein